MASMKKYNIKSSIINAKEAIAELTGVDVSDQKICLLNSVILRVLQEWKKVRN